MKQKSLFMIILVFLVILPGCWDLEEIDHRAFVTALGIDMKSKKLVVLTAQLPMLKDMLPPGAPGGSKEGKNYHTISVRSNSVYSAFGILQAKTYRDLVIQQNRLIVIGEETARAGVWPVLDWLMKNPMLPPQALIYVARGRSARDLLSVTPTPSDMPGLGFNTAKAVYIQHGHTFFMPAWRFRKIMTNPTGDLYAPMADFDAKDGQFIKEGLAVFDGDHFAGELNREETRIFGFLTNHVLAGSKSYRINRLTGVEFSLRNMMVTTRLKVRLLKGEPYFIVKTEVKGAIAEITGIQHRLTTDFIKQLEKTVQRDTQSKIEKLIHKLQSLHSDPVQFGEQLRAQHYGLWKKMNWKDVFPKVPFKVSVRAKIIRNGIFL